jgi:Ran GTPase-activating protein (RanGAP) involved in mRNA processing and transport
MSIKELNLSKNPLGPEGVTVLSNALRKRRRLDSLIMLHSLDLSGTDCGKEGASSALTCDAVQRLNLFNNGLGADNFSSIAAHLVGGHHSLETIDLGGNLADSNAVLEILNALAQKSESFENRLKTIILGGNTTNDIIYSLVRKIAIIHPELDVAMDRPTNEEERFN